jgi:hypothetical protein
MYSALNIVLEYLFAKTCFVGCDDSVWLRMIPDRRNSVQWLLGCRGPLQQFRQRCLGSFLDQNQARIGRKFQTNFQNNMQGTVNIVYSSLFEAVSQHLDWLIVAVLG